MANRPVDDPLYYGEILMKDGEVPQLTSGQIFKDHLDDLLRDGKELKDIITAPDNIMKFFDQAFPEIVDSNQVGQMSQKDFELWKPENNVISVEFDTKPRPDTPGKDVYIGGPAALYVAALEAETKQTAGLDPGSSAPEILYGHNGSRGASNWKGSASYYHIVDTVPVYYWPDNTGAYVLSNTIRNGFRKAISPEKYKREVYEDPNFNKLNVDVFAIAKSPGLIKLCLKNAMYTMRDVGLPLTKNIRLGPFRWSDEQAVAHTTLEHGHLTREMLEKLPTEKPILIKSNEFHRALRTHVGEGKGDEISSAYEGLKRYSREHLEMRKMSKSEVEARGYDTNLVTEGGEFPYDGYFPPYMDQVLEKKVEQSGGTVNGNMLLKKVLVAPTGSNGDCEVTRIVWENTQDGKELETPVNELFLSLGPSAKQILLKQPQYTIKSHLSDFFSSKLSPLTNTGSPQPNVYPPTLKALVRHAVNNVSSYVGKNNLINDIMWASALTAVLMVKVDPSKVPEFKIRKFRDHLNGHNKHVVRLAEKELTTASGKKYLLFALQLTGGGNFPSRHCHPEAAINAMWANTVPVLGMEDEGVEYDVISARSCARGVTAQNVFRMTAPFRNMVKIYGIGGLGMTTMAPNAVLMKAVMDARQQLADGKITDTEFNRKLKESDFGMIRSYGANPFSRNYAQFIDNAANPKRVCRKMGVDSNIPALREFGGRAVGRVAQLTTQLYKKFGFALRRKVL